MNAYFRVQSIANSFITEAGRATHVKTGCVTDTTLKTMIGESRKALMQRLHIGLGFLSLSAYSFPRFCNPSENAGWSD
jgi:hypothetical protein